LARPERRQPYWSASGTLLDAVPPAVNVSVCDPDSPAGTVSVKISMPGSINGTGTSDAVAVALPMVAVTVGWPEIPVA
jgi:hypothetical protein